MECAKVQEQINQMKMAPDSVELTDEFFDHFDDCTNSCEREYDTAIKDNVDLLDLELADLVGSPHPDHKTRPGDFIGQLDEYQIERRIGGGMSIVYRARDRKGSPVAVKFVGADDETSTKRFIREWRQLNGVNHPNLVRMLENGVDEHDQQFFVMEWIEGHSVEELLALDGTMEIAEACAIVYQAVQALQAIHEKGIVHRDVKPSNLMITKNGTVKLLDLGIAFSPDNPNRLTKAVQICGTADYMSPEQTQLGTEHTSASDVYSLGCTFFAMLMNSPPFAALSSDTLKHKAHREEVAPSLPIDVPKQIADLATRMMNKSPEQRPSLETVARIAEPLAKDADLITIKQRLELPFAEPAPAASNTSHSRRSLLAMGIGGIGAMAGGWAGVILGQEETKNPTHETPRNHSKNTGDVKPITRSQLIAAHTKVQRFELPIVTAQCDTTGLFGDPGFKSDGEALQQHWGYELEDLSVSRGSHFINPPTDFRPTPAPGKCVSLFRSFSFMNKSKNAFYVRNVSMAHAPSDVDKLWEETTGRGTFRARTRYKRTFNGDTSFTLAVKRGESIKKMTIDLKSPYAPRSLWLEPGDELFFICQGKHSAFRQVADANSTNCIKESRPGDDPWYASANGLRLFRGQSRSNAKGNAILKFNSIWVGTVNIAGSYIGSEYYSHDEVAPLIDENKTLREKLSKLESALSK